MLTRRTAASLKRSPVWASMAARRSAVMVVAPMPASWATIPTSTVAMSGTCPLSTAVISLVIRSPGRDDGVLHLDARRLRPRLDELGHELVVEGDVFGLIPDDQSVGSTGAPSEREGHEQAEEDKRTATGRTARTLFSPFSAVSPWRPTGSGPSGAGAPRPQAPEVTCLHVYSGAAGSRPRSIKKALQR